MYVDDRTDLKRDEPDKVKLVKAIEELEPHDHLCLIYETLEEQMSAAVPFINAGLECGDRCIYIADDNDANSVKQAMRAAGMDVDKALASGALAVVTKNEAYLKQGFFDPDWMIAFLKESTDTAVKDGYRALRATGEMTWIFSGEPGVDRLIEYEAKLNYFFPKYEALAICQYNRNRFDPQIINNVIYTHPLVIYGTDVCKNPYYIPPDEFLSDDVDREAIEAERLLSNIVARQRAEEGMLASQQSLEDAFVKLKSADESLKESEARYRTLFEAESDAIFLFDQQTGRIIECNEAATSLYGFNREELLEMINTDVSAEPEETSAATREPSKQIQVRYHRKKDGTVFPVEITNSAVAIDGRDTILCAIRDISERLRMEEALRGSESKYRTLFDNSPDALLVIDPDTGLPVEFNDRTPQLLGYTPEEFAKLRVWDYEELENADEARAQINRMLREGNDQFESQLRHKDGSVRDVRISSQPVEFQGRQLLHSIITDITDNKRRERKLKHLMGELERSNEELQQFADVASHDLQEPLRMVASYVQLLRDRYEGRLDGDADDFIGYAVDGANRMQNIISDLLAYARVGSRGKPFATVEMDEVLCKATTSLSKAIDETGTLITADEMPQITADRSQLIQLLQNLIGNAIKFHGSESPSIHLSASERQNEWLFSVSDNGIGISPEYFNRIFVIFQRLHGREEYPGTGVGLAICKRIVERHGGRIWVESEPGKGSIFFFSIPRNPAEEANV